VDAEVEGIGWQGVNANFGLLTRQLSIFLRVVVGVNARNPEGEQVWTWELDETRKTTNCHLRQRGYHEPAPQHGMPQMAGSRPVALVKVERPGLEPLGIRLDDNEKRIPHDTSDLWRQLTFLPPEKREHFLRAGNAYGIARSMWPDQCTAYLAFLVVACESLKPVGKRHNKAKISAVVEGLLGTAEADQLRQLQLVPQRLRDDHFHRGELAAGELVSFLLQSHFGDPSFREAADALDRTTRLCLIEWLRRDGEYDLKS
jgi:hypothetical protein